MAVVSKLHGTVPTSAPRGPTSDIRELVRHRTPRHAGPADGVLDGLDYLQPSHLERRAIVRAHAYRHRSELFDRKEDTETARERSPAFAASDHLAAALLSGVAGYVDTAGFLALFGLFTAHVTGDLVSAGAVVSQNKTVMGTGARLAMIPIFMLTVASSTLAVRLIRRHGRPPLTPLLALMTSALAVFCAMGIILCPFVDGPDSWAVILIGATGVVAMGIQNTLMRAVLNSLSATTLMTGNLTQFTIDLVEIACPEPASVNTRLVRRNEARVRLRKFGVPLLGFMLGATLGALLTSTFGLLSIALPTAVTGALTWHSRRHSRTAA